jgi:hypothetical protein
MRICVGALLVAIEQRRKGAPGARLLGELVGLLVTSLQDISVDPVLFLARFLKLLVSGSFTLLKLSVSVSLAPSDASPVRESSSQLLMSRVRLVRMIRVMCPRRVVGVAQARPSDSS